MTEDEAFIRTIVDSPGDDLPRLVYADWLDERNDPRGAYLRAELELVHNDDTGSLRVLRHSTRTIPDFDPVWASRVSRPPAGVCCDHLRLRDCGPCSAEQLANVEAELGVRLSTGLTAFQLNYNGGSDWHRVILPSNGRYHYTIDEFARGVRTANGPGADGPTLIRQTRAFWGGEFDLEEEAAIAPTLLPIAVMNGLFLFEQLATDNAGVIVICDTGDGELRQMRRLAPDLAVFFGMLRLRGGGS